MSGLLAPILSSGLFQAASAIIGIMFLVITIAMVYWLYRDAIKRSAGAIIWGAIGLVCAFIGIIAGLPFIKYGLALVGLLPFFTVISLVIIYMIVRPAEFTADAQERDLSLRLLDAELENKACPKCGTGIDGDYLICPECLSELRVKCDYCGRPVKPNWHACPYCQSKRRTASDRLSGVGTGSFADVDFDF
ncbi:MAG: zinc ribbon domain-containing protein [Actinomycetia bacterium]|nr:zinc ribbon domain-containing protein [Actinomycetes bacterium]